MVYAKGTSVPVEQTEMDIKKLLRANGANAIITGIDGDRGIVLFEMNGRRIRFAVTWSPLDSYQKVAINQHADRKLTKAEQKEAYEQGMREKWRLLFLLIKAKLEMLAGNIEMFEQEFLAYIVLPDNRTFGEWAKPELEEAYTTGKMPPLLPGAGPKALPEGGKR